MKYYTRFILDGFWTITKGNIFKVINCLLCWPFVSLICGITVFSSLNSQYTLEQCNLNIVQASKIDLELQYDWFINYNGAVS